MATDYDGEAMGKSRHTTINAVEATVSLYKLAKKSIRDPQLAERVLDSKAFEDFTQDFVERLEALVERDLDAVLDEVGAELDRVNTIDDCDDILDDDGGDREDFPIVKR